MMKLRYFLPFLALSATLRTTAAEPPRLVVQIVVSSMRAEDLNRYADNFSDEGFLRLVRGGTFYPESHYDYLHTSTPVSLATLTTGANPSVHGIVAERWIDYVNNNVVELIKDRSAMGIDCDAGIGDCLPCNLWPRRWAKASNRARPRASSPPWRSTPHRPSWQAGTRVTYSGWTPRAPTGSPRRSMPKRCPCGPENTTSAARFWDTFPSRGN